MLAGFDICLCSSAASAPCYVIAEFAAYSVRRRVSIADSIPVPAIRTFSLAAASRRLQYLATFFVAQQDGFAGRALNHDAVIACANMLNILFQLAKVNSAVGIKGVVMGGKIPCRSIEVSNVIIGR